MAITKTNTVTTTDPALKPIRVEVDTEVFAIAKTPECTNVNLYMACFDAMLTAAVASNQNGKQPLEALKVIWAVPVWLHGKLKGHDHTFEARVSCDTLYEMLAKQLSKDGQSNFQHADDLVAEKVYEAMVEDKLLIRTRRGWTMRPDPNRPAYTGKRTPIEPQGLLG